MTRNAIAALAAFTALTLGSSSASAQYNIKFAHPAPTIDAAHKAIEFFSEKVAERTKNRVKVTIFPSSQLGKEQQIIQGLQSGAIEMCFFSTTHLVNSVPAFGVLDLPFLVTRNEDVGRLLEGEIGTRLMAALPEKGMRGLAFSESNFRSVFTKQPVDSLEQLQGLKLRVPNSPVYVGIIKAMGALPTPIAFGELYGALQQGVVDGAETAGSSYWSYKFYEVGKHWVVTNHTILPGIYLISEKFWQTLPPDLQKIVHDTAKEAGLFHRKLSWEDDGIGLKNAQGKGAQIHTLKGLNTVIEKARAQYPEFAKAIGPDLVSQVSSIFPGK